MEIRNIIRRIARRIGVKTSYHIAAMYMRDSHVSGSQLSMTCTMKPWLHADNYRELVDFVKSQAPGAVSDPSITSITRLGI